VDSLPCDMCMQLLGASGQPALCMMST